MRNRGVVIKLFVLIASFFLFFYAIMTWGQLLFFEDFYQNQKIHSLTESTHAFREDYAKGLQDENSVAVKIARFINENNAQIAILDQDNDVKHSSPYKMVVKTDEGRSIHVSLYEYDDIAELLASKLQPGDRVTIEGNYEDQTHTDLLPIHIEVSDSSKGDYPQAAVGTDSKSEEPAQRITGLITDLLLPEKNKLNSFFQESLLDDAIDKWYSVAQQYEHRLKKGETIHLNWDDQQRGIKHSILVEPVIIEGNVRDLILVSTSMQPVGEAVKAMKLFFVYVAVGGMILIVLLSILFSKIVAKPLLSLNQTALRMAKLDFSAKSAIQSNDEFGSLSQSLNTLSENLDLTLQELRQSNEKLQDDVERKRGIEQMRKEFIANASHELKTPLGIIKGFAEGLKDGVAVNKRERYINVILDETEKMDELVKDMLELSQLEAKTARMDYSLFSINALVQGSFAKFTYFLNEKQILAKMRADENYHVYADKRKIEQVLNNLMSNAINHTVEGSEMLVSLERVGEGVRISVENKGNRIPEELLERIWESFYRVEQSRDRKSGGTGLGLAIVKHILELHESRYGVTNTQEGVRVYFTLRSSQPLTVHSEQI